MAGWARGGHGFNHSRSGDGEQAGRRKGPKFTGGNIGKNTQYVDLIQVVLKMASTREMKHYRVGRQKPEGEKYTWRKEWTGRGGGNEIE